MKGGAMENRLSGQKGVFFFSKNKGHKLLPAELPEEKFWLLAEISPIRSEKVLYALRDYLVLGYLQRKCRIQRNYRRLRVNKRSAVTKFFTNRVWCTDCGRQW